MNQNLSPLIELQKLDLRIAEIKEQRRKIPERLQVVDLPLREARQLHQETSGSVETLIKERRSSEHDLEAHEAHTDKMKSRLSELKSNKEYQAHLFEIEVANKKKGDISNKPVRTFLDTDMRWKQAEKSGCALRLKKTS